MVPTVLIAAHDPWFLQLLRMYTQESGFRAVQVYEGQDVLPMIRQEKPEVVLLQLDLPGHVKGLDVLRALRSDNGACTIPVLVFTWHDQSLPQDAREGIAAHLREPVTYEMFVDALQKAGLHPIHKPPSRISGREHSRSTSDD
jgi:CheY-like chemotaxis protein